MNFRLEYYSKGADYWWVLYAIAKDSLFKQEQGRGITPDYMWNDFVELFVNRDILSIELLEVH